MDCHGNHTFIHSQNKFFLSIKMHSRGPNEQFGIHEKLSWGGDAR